MKVQKPEGRKTGRRRRDDVRTSVRRYYIEHPTRPIVIFEIHYIFMYRVSCSPFPISHINNPPHVQLTWSLLYLRNLKSDTPSLSAHIFHFVITSTDLSRSATRALCLSPKEWCQPCWALVSLSHVSLGGDHTVGHALPGKAAPPAAGCAGRASRQGHVARPHSADSLADALCLQET